MPKIIHESGVAIREILAKTAPEVLSTQLVSFSLYYKIACVIVFCGIAIIIFILKRHMTVFYVKRDYHNLVVSLQSNNTRLPAATLNDLITHITGSESKHEANYYTTVRDILFNNIQPIKSFLEKGPKEDCILYINSSWGTGKTTSVLVAIDQFSYSAHKKQIRYIYESAFKYTRLTKGFQTNLLNAIQDTLYEFNVPKSIDIANLLENIEPSLLTTLFNMIKTSTHQQKAQLTNDYIQRINQWYDTNRKDDFNIIIIIDDIDRLQGEEIIQTLSLISILRRIKFIKIIIPADSNAIVQHLSGIGIYQPKTFIQKYIPDSSSISLKTNGEVIEPIILQKIRSLQEEPQEDIQSYKPALAAILFKTISDTLNNKAEKWNSYRFRWVHEINHNTTMDMTFKNNGVDSDSQYILSSALNHIHEAILAERSEHPGSTFPRYVCNTQATNDARRFEDILFSVTREEDINHKHKISNQLTTEYYNDLVGSWIFDFAYQNWEILGLTLRTILDNISSQNFSNLNPHPNKQFQQAFNQLLATKTFSIKTPTNLI